MDIDIDGYRYFKLVVVWKEFRIDCSRDKSFHGTIGKTQNAVAVFAFSFRRREKVIKGRKRGAQGVTRDKDHRPGYDPDDISFFKERKKYMN